MGMLTLWVIFLVALSIPGIECVKQREVLEPNGRYIVEWEVNFEEKIVVFDVTAETTGFVAFGLSPAGGMAGSDIIVGGIYPNGSSYLVDYHGLGDFAPRPDRSQDWRLISAFENATHTFLRFTRLLETCDLDEDVAITNDTLSMIWALGHEDSLHYHSGERGSVSVNLLDPPQPSVDISSFKSWKMTVDIVMPSEKSYAYWCTIYKGPDFGSKKTHVVGFRPLVKGALAVKHTHHFVIYRCTNPPGTDANKIFGPFADVTGDNCYTKEAMAKRPSQMCGAVLYVWGAGGKEMFLPEHVGYPVQDNDFYMLEIHYDNPQQVRDAKFETGVEVFYTDKLRKYDAGMMTMGHTVVASLMIPPRTNDFQIVGHCSEHCTQLALPPEGMNIFNILMHTHLQGRRMRLRQFRNGTELPWVSNDDHYNFKYQKNRPLREERKILPGDSLAFECHYDTSSRDKLTTAGYSTRNEMCESFIWYYPKLPLESCASFYPIEKLYEKFGIKDVEWNVGLEGGPQPVIKSPASMANKTFSQALDENINWTPEFTAELQKLLVESDHVSICSGKGPEQGGAPPPGLQNQRGGGPHDDNVRLGGRHPPPRREHAPPPRGPLPPPGPGGEGPGLPPGMPDIFRVNYPKLDKVYSPPQTCSNEENLIDS